MSTVNFIPDKKRYPGLCTAGKFIKPLEKKAVLLEGYDSDDGDEVGSIKQPGKESGKGNSEILSAFKQPKKESGEADSTFPSASKQTEKEISNRLRQEIHPNQMTPEELAAHNKKCDESEAVLLEVYDSDDGDEVGSIKQPGKESGKGNIEILSAFRQPKKESGEADSTFPSASKQTEKEISDRLRQEIHPNQMTPEELAAHNKKCDESEGFDVPDVPSHIVDNVLRPSHLQNDPDALQRAFGGMSKIALEDYNRVKGTLYQFVKVIKVNTEYSGTVWHYVTFQAKKDGCPPQNFQARICPPRVEKMVEFCRLEVKPDIP